MGFISQMVKAHKANDGRESVSKATNQSRALWREVFGNTAIDKESGSRHPNDGKGGSYANSIANHDSSLKRLLEAMRARSPGAPADDHYEQTKHFVGITYVGIHRQNELLTQSEFQVYEKDEAHPDGKRPARSDAAKRLIRLLEHPNKEDSFGDLLAQWNLQQDLTGIAYTWMVPNQLGEPYELYSIPTATVIGQPVINPQYPEGYYRIQPVYPYGPFSSYPTPASSVGAAIPAQWMMRFKYPHPLLRYAGYSPLTALRLHLDEIEGIDKSRFYKMKKTFRPNVVLQLEEMEGAQPMIDAEIERIRAEFESEFQGAENAGKLLISPPGGRLEEFGTTPADMDYQSGWEQLVSFALGGLGITKPAAGMVEDSAYANLFASLKQLYWLTLNPKVDRIAAKLTRWLAPFFGNNLIIEIRCKRIDDHEVTFTKIDKGINSKCIRKNEVRKMLELPVTKETWGEDIAGDPSPNEVEQQKQQQQKQQQMGAPGSQGQSVDLGTADPGLAADPSEKERPTPGTLNQGSLGPRMKYLQVRKSPFLNGHHKRLR